MTVAVIIFKQMPKDHQKAGVKWLWRRICANTGGILGDEMGLGKVLVSNGLIN